MRIPKFNLERRRDKEGNVISKNVPVRLSFYVRGKRLEYYTGVRITNAKNFNSDYFKTGKVYIKSNEPDAGTINTRLEKIKTKANFFYDQAIALGQMPTCDTIKKQLDDFFKAKDTKSDQVLVKDAFNEFLEFIKIKKAYRTWQKYNSTYNHLSITCGKNFNKLSFDEINTAFVEKFKKDLIKRGYKEGEEKKEFLNNTLVKYLRSFREFLNWCKDEKREYYKGNAKFEEIKENDINVIYLSSDEIAQLIKTEMPTRRLQEVKDVFLFGYYTGMRYGDIYKLRKKDVLDQKIRFYIMKGSHTTWHYIPLVEQSQAILEKYKFIEGEKALPVISNQKMNDYLKVVMKHAEINEPLTIRRVKGDGSIVEIEYPKWQLVTCHTSRKSFITYAVDQGMNELEIKSITGHSKNSRAFTKYYEISDEKKRSSLKKVFGVDPLSKLKAV